MDNALQEKAQAIWENMTENEKRGVRFGMFPAGKMDEAEKEGFDGQQLAVALMNCANPAR